MKKTLIAINLLTSSFAYSHITNSDPNSVKAIYADLPLLKKANIPVLYADENTQVGYAVVSGNMEQRLSQLAHEQGRCGNFEALDEIPQNLNVVKNNFSAITEMQNKNTAYLNLAKKNLSIKVNENIKEALQELKSENIRANVTWLSSYPSRYNRATNPNIHVNDMAEKLKTLVSTANFPVSVDLISHNKTPQKSIRVSIKGSTRPNEIIVLGAHLDSINGWGFASKPAPGADDNASGSSSLIEALRVLVSQQQPQRTVEFFWYAGEESGLLGSAEIAQTYKNENKNVIAVLQLDMTMFPGDGDNKITSINDFTSAWLRDYLKAINTAYLNIQILDDQCGYGCSDHASWHRRGYPTLMPTEAKFNSMFHDIHTEKDVISPVMSFEHSLIFSKIALVLAMDLGNSTQKESLF